MHLGVSVRTIISYLDGLVDALKGNRLISCCLSIDIFVLTDKCVTKFFRRKTISIERMDNGLTKFSRRETISIKQSYTMNFDCLRLNALTDKEISRYARNDERFDRKTPSNPQRHDVIPNEISPFARNDGRFARKTPSNPQRHDVIPNEISRYARNDGRFDRKMVVLYLRRSRKYKTTPPSKSAWRHSERSEESLIPSGINNKSHFLQPKEWHFKRVLHFLQPKEWHFKHVSHFLQPKEWHFKHVSHFLHLKVMTASN